MRDTIDAERFRRLLRNGTETSGRFTFLDFAKAIKRWPDTVSRTLAAADRGGTITRSKAEEWQDGLSSLLGRPVELHEFTVEKRTNGSEVIYGEDKRHEKDRTPGERDTSSPGVLLLEASK